MLQPNPLTTTPWPITPDAPDLHAIVVEQADTIASQEALLHAYQGVLNTAQAAPNAIGTGSAAGTTTLTVSGASGVILVGSIITGPGVPAAPPATTVVAGPQGGGNGSYTTSQALTLNSAALVFTPGGGPMPWPIRPMPTRSMPSCRRRPR